MTTTPPPFDLMALLTRPDTILDLVAYQYKDEQRRRLCEDRRARIMSAVRADRRAALTSTTTPAN